MFQSKWGLSIIIISISLVGSLLINSLLDRNSSNSNIIMPISSNLPVVQETISNTLFTLEVATTSTEINTGLMYRQTLSKNYGMLFVFNSSRVRSFWMKNTYIPLDIIYLDQDQTIINIHRNTPPCTSEPCPTYKSISPAQYVLELNAGKADKLNLKPGIKLQLQYLQ